MNENNPENSENEMGPSEKKEIESNAGIPGNLGGEGEGGSGGGNGDQANGNDPGGEGNGGSGAGNGDQANGNDGDNKDSGNIGGPNVENIENIENVQIHNHPFYEYLPQIITGLIIVVVVLGTSFLLSKSEADFFDKGDAGAARGLITFLVAVVTITIALILTISAAWSNAPDFKERFALGKEILTILIGVLGTIIGFYFGSADKPVVNVGAPVVAETQTFQVIPLNLSNDQVTSSVGAIITAAISGGKSPYKYSIIFSTPLIEAISGDSPTGFIQAEVKKPASGFEVDKEVSYRIEVTDAENNKVTLKDDKVKKFIVKNQ